MNLLPPFRPSLPLEKALSLLAKNNISHPVALIGIRGYFRNSMGKPGKNDRGLYDDALLIVSLDNYFTYNGNTDPVDETKGRAVLEPGVWIYKIGIHGVNKPLDHQYRALVQARPVTVKRDGIGLDTGMFGINIHSGGMTTTGSEGCQTLPPQQWHSFFTNVTAEMDKFSQAYLPYLLIENDGSIA